MWAIKNPDGVIMSETLSDTKDDALMELFDQMDDAFRGEFWKDLVGSRKEYKRLGFRAVKVKLTEVKK
jgi:hypothetical protein